MKKMKIKKYPIIAEPCSIFNALVMVTSRCNQRCVYCQLYNSQTFEKKMDMSKATIEHTVDYFTEVGGDGFQYGIFGGEPLLQFDKVKHLIEYARNRSEVAGKHVKFLLFTNGTLLHLKYYDYLIRNDVKIQIDLDGPASVHNKLRPKDLKGAHGEIIKNINKIKRKHGCLRNLIVNTTITRGNLELVDYAKRYEEMGFEYVRFYPVSTGMDDVILRKDDYDYLIGQFEILVEFYKKRSKSGKGIKLLNFAYPLMMLRGESVTIYRCGAGAGVVLVHPSGEIYPCMMLAEKKYSLGDVFKGISRSRRARFLEGLSIYDNKECCDCSANNLCLLSCFYRNRIYSGDLSIPERDSCDFIRAMAGMINGLHREGYE